MDAGVDRSTISGIENATYNPSVDLLERLSKALDVDIAELFAPTKGAAPNPLPAGRKRSTR